MRWFEALRSGWTLGDTLYVCLGLAALGFWWFCLYVIPIAIVDSFIDWQDEPTGFDVSCKEWMPTEPGTDERHCVVLATFHRIEFIQSRKHVPDGPAIVRIQSAWGGIRPGMACLATCIGIGTWFLMWPLLRRTVFVSD